MAEVVNLDALIPREDFLAPLNDGHVGLGGKPSAAVTDLLHGESFFSTLRKPDFQRETAAWSPEQIKDFVIAFIQDDLIPSVICWQSEARLSFVIDGAHRLSAIIAWLLDDYGDGDVSKTFYGHTVPDDQFKIATKTRLLINNSVGSYKQFREETVTPGKHPHVSKNVRNIAHAKIPLLWVTGSDWKKAERAFFVINQSAVQIDPTELAILNARSEPNAIAARAIVRKATGHKYWEKFSQPGQEEVEAFGRNVYKALYSPPIDPPIRNEDLPVAGHGYGQQTLPLIFDFVNLANKFALVDASKLKKKMGLVIERKQPDEQQTLRALKNTEKLASRFTGELATSFGLHPAIYFYSSNGRHQPTAVLAMAALITGMNEDEKEYVRFTRNRAAFEQFLITHKSNINQLTVQHGSMAKGYAQVRDYFAFVLSQVELGKSEAEIEQALSEHEKFRKLTKEKVMTTTQSKAFSQKLKQWKFLNDALEHAFVCGICGARIDKKSMQLDHEVDKKYGGLGGWRQLALGSSVLQQHVQEASCQSWRRGFRFGLGTGGVTTRIARSNVLPVSSTSCSRAVSANRFDCSASSGLGFAPPPAFRVGMFD